MTDRKAKLEAALSKLEDNERLQILSVVNKDEIIRVHHELYIMRLKSELQAERRKGALKNGTTVSSRNCARCRAELGRIINRGAFCRWCRHRVCKNCREYVTNETSDWLCTVCHKQMELTAASGDWMNQFVRRPSKRRDSRIAAVETVKRSLQRSWTFSDASPSPWAALRNSPEMRAYSSMPRHQDCEFIARTAFTNRLNLTKTESDMSEQETANNVEEKTKEEEKSDGSIIAMTDSGTMEDKASDSEPSIEENPVTDNESSVGSPTINKRSISESTSVDQSSIGSPIIDNRFCHDSPVGSSSESPLVEKRVNDAVIEPITGTVFRKVTLKKRRVDTRNLPPGVTPPRSRRNVVPRLQDDVDLRDREDYKLVFISSSDSSSREELQSDDGDGSSTCSGLMAGSECDWDYFEPGGGGGESSVVPHQSSVGSASAPVATVPVLFPVPIPVPVPVLVPIPWTPDLTIRIQHLWSMQQLVTVTLNDGQMSQRLSEDLRLATLKHFQDLATAAAAAAAWPDTKELVGKEPIVDNTQNKSIPDYNKVIVNPDSSPASDVIKCDCIDSGINRDHVISVVPSDAIQIVSDHNDNINHSIESDSNKIGNNDNVSNKTITFYENVENNALNYASINCGRAELFSPINLSVSEKSETEGIVLKNYKPLEINELEDSIEEGLLKRKEECLGDFMEARDDESGSSDSSDEASSGEKTTKRFYKFNQEEESEESGDDEESSGEFSMASSLSSSPGSGKFKRVYVVNDSDSDLGELPEYNDDSAQEEGEVTLLKHVNMDEVRLSDILHDGKGMGLDNRNEEVVVPMEIERKDLVHEDTFCESVDGDSSSLALQDSLECSVLAEQELPESEHEVCLSIPLSEDKATDSDKCASAIAETLDSVESMAHNNNGSTTETGEFLLKEIEYCDKFVSRSSGDFILTKPVEGSDEECGKLCETRGSNTSDEFSGTESMELEQGQVRSAGPVTAAGESWRETGRYTSLVMITQEHLEAVSVVTSDTTTLVPEPEGERFTLTLDTTLPGSFTQDDSEVHVVTGNGTTAVVILEEGLPDDDSWVEELDRDELVTTTEDSSEDDTSYVDREEELRGYNPRSAIDFTLHTIVEESCEESEVEIERTRPTELEKYFFYGVGDGLTDNRELDTMSETSSIHSEGLESLGGFDEGENEGKDPAELASSRLEKYFLSGLLGCSRRDSDGSVGSDSEGKPSPEQRRKRLVRARGTGRQHSNSQDNLNESEQQDEAQVESEGSSTETDSNNELSNSFDKNDGQFDTVKRTKKKKRSVVTAPSLDLLEAAEDPSGSGSREEVDSDDGNKTPQPEFLLPADLSSSRNKQQSRDSGFMGSCDDLLKENKDLPSCEIPGVSEIEVEKVPEITNFEEATVPQVKISPPTGLIRKDSFNNWSSDEETNLMMSKMRQFFKTMVASQPKVSSPVVGARSKPPQLVHFESELTRLMKTVPGIRDEQVKEIVEYLSSEDTWSDSYDSSDYTSSDLEGGNKKTALQEEISASCRQIISNFEAVEDPSANSADGLNKDTAFVYHRLVASFSKLEAPSSDSSASHNSPPLIAKVMQHIGSRLVALMHEVSSAEGGSPKTSRYHRRLQPKLSTTSTTEDEEDSIEDYSPLPRSKSHDPLIEENRQEASDNERFSWRGSFESALMASDSRTRLASGGEGSVSASALALAAKRRSAGDLLFKTSSREQLDRVRSCGSIGGSVEDKIWGLRHQKRRRSSVPDSGGSNDGDDDSEEDSGRSTTLPRSLQSSCAATNSLPRLPTTPTSASPSIYKAHSVHQVSVSKSVVSARYRPPGYSSRSNAVVPPRRDARRRATQTPSPSNLSSPPSVVSDDASVCSESVSVRAPEEEDRLTNNRASLGARSDSLASVYSGAGEGRYGSVAVKGEVEFGLQYNYKQGALEIYVKQCRDLAAVDTKRNRSDPYVKVYLLPDKSKSGKRKTRVKKHTLNPIFEETLKFHITLEGLESRTLWLSVWHSDMFGRNDFLGEVTMALENKVFDDPLPKFYTLQERTEPLEELLSSKSELIVGLKFVPPEASTNSKKTGGKGCLQVLVKEAKNLAAVKSNGTSDPFCKSYLLPDKGRSSKQKTPVLRKNCSPAWHHTFTYAGITLEELSSRSLELTIWDHDRLASNEFLGGVRLNLGTGKHSGKAVDWMDASGKETTLWQRMLERPNLWVESCLPLRPSLDVRNNS